MKTRSTLLVLLLLVFLSCLKENTSASDLTILPNEIEVGSAEFEENVKIATNSKWSIENDFDWLAVSPICGQGNLTIKIKIGKNTSSDQRKAIIRISTNQKNKVVRILQSGKDSIDGPGEGDNPNKDNGFNDGYKGWKLVFSDDFTDSSLDLTKWRYISRDYPRINWTKYMFDSKKYSLLDGENLILMFAKAPAGSEFPYQSSAVDSKFSFTYGKLEVRAKFKEGQGSWPAIWTMPRHEDPAKGGYGTWPKSGEIDIMEHYNQKNDIEITVHTADTHNSDGSASSTAKAKFNKNEYNIYGMEWSADSINFYVNKDLIYTYKKPKNATPNNWPFNIPHYLILDQIGDPGSWAGPVDDSQLSFEMIIDWVKIFQKK